MTSTVGIDSSWMSPAPQLPGWLETHSWNRPEWTVEQLIAAKKGRTVSVVLPALNEQETVAAVIDTISPLLGGLVDELIVLDSGSTDDTAIRAVAAGARVVSREQALPEVPPNPARARCCGGRWPRPPVTSSRSSTPI
ncbi:glycosyl transferase 2 family protein [Mycobacteroides abscessus MAB_110811_2726]|nr:glycosyl transferase 2 family protein [Mycobacteroides abscessus MAB_110811_2726]